MSSQAHRVCLVCHGALSTNSGRHVRSLAMQLQATGWSTTICVPSVAQNEEASLDGIDIRTFPDHLNDPDHADHCLYHYWTPREMLREFHVALSRRSQQKSIKYVVHFEDDESILLRDQLKISAPCESYSIDRTPDIQVPPHLTHPVHGRHFAEKAHGLTALTAALLEDFNHNSTAVFWPGYDDHFAQIATQASLQALRQELNIPTQHYIVTYIGNLHFSNAEEVRSLYLAVALVNRVGLPLTLIRTGHDAVPLSDHGTELLKKHVRELGHVPQARLPLLLQLADILVQPGRDDTWNRKRVPSKLPEFLVSGRPVVLPRANLGSVLQDGKDAIVLEHGTAASIAEALLKYLPDPDSRAEIGRRGRLFALEQLQWKKAGEKVADLYTHILHNK